MMCRASGEEGLMCLYGNGYKMAEVCPCRASGLDEIWAEKDGFKWATIGPDLGLQNGP